MAIDVRELVGQAHEAMMARRVFSEPFTRDGVTVILASRVQGGGGGGSGEQGAGPDHEAQNGWGGGFGLSAAPVGAYVIRGDRVDWVPAVDVTRLALGGQVVGLMALLLVGRIVRARRRRR